MHGLWSHQVIPAQGQLPTHAGDHCVMPAMKPCLPPTVAVAVIMPTPRASVQKLETAPKIQPSQLDHHARESSTAENGTGRFQWALPVGHASGISSGTGSSCHSHYLTVTMPRKNKELLLFPNIFLFLKLQGKGSVYLFCKRPFLKWC